MTLPELEYIFLTHDYTLLTLFERLRIYYYRLLVADSGSKSDGKLKHL